jgi:hypothetical protein
MSTDLNTLRKAARDAESALRAGQQAAAPNPAEEREAQDLIKASFQRHLTKAEDSRLAALTWTTDEGKERILLIRDRAPDLLALVPTDHIAGLDAYERKRAEAKAAGRTVADPTPAAIADVDRAAIAARKAARKSTSSVAQGSARVSRYSIAAGDFGGMVRAWSDWVGARKSANAAASRKAAAERSLGRAAFPDHRMELNWTDEFELAIGGRTVADDRPIIQR